MIYNNKSIDGIATFTWKVPLVFAIFLVQCLILLFLIYWWFWRIKNTSIVQCNVTSYIGNFREEFSNSQQMSISKELKSNAMKL